MMLKRLFPILISAMLFFSFSSAAHAEFFSVSAGIPVAHNLSNSYFDSDGVSGYMVHFKLPIMLGLGMEAYETKVDHSDATVSDMKLKTNMYDIFWLTPIPVINFTIGAGVGTVEATCTVSNGTNCGDYYDKSPVTQLWGQLGINVLPFIDIHLSYHRISGNLTGKNGTDDTSAGGSLYAAGVSFIF